MRSWSPVRRGRPAGRDVCAVDDGAGGADGTVKSMIQDISPTSLAWVRSSLDD